MLDNSQHGFTAKQLANLANAREGIVVGAVDPRIAEAERNEARRQARLAQTGGLKPSGSELGIIVAKRKKDRAERDAYARKILRMVSPRLMLVLNRDYWKCGLCGDPIRPDRSSWDADSRPTIDHIWPRSWPSRTWLDRPVNLRPAHGDCNRERGNTWDPYRDPPALERNGFDVQYL